MIRETSTGSSSYPLTRSATTPRSEVGASTGGPSSTCVGRTSWPSSPLLFTPWLMDSSTSASSVFTYTICRCPPRCSASFAGRHRTTTRTLSPSLKPFDPVEDTVPAVDTPFRRRPALLCRDGPITPVSPTPPLPMGPMPFTRLRRALLCREGPITPVASSLPAPAAAEPRFRRALLWRDGPITPVLPKEEVEEAEDALLPPPLLLLASRSRVRLAEPGPRDPVDGDERTESAAERTDSAVERIDCIDSVECVDCDVPTRGGIGAPRAFPAAALPRSPGCVHGCASASPYPRAPPTCDPPYPGLGGSTGRLSVLSRPPRLTRALCARPALLPGVPPPPPPPPPPPVPSRLSRCGVLAPVDAGDTLPDPRGGPRMSSLVRV